jgi:DNA-binding response OmpR family regulator
MKVLVVDDDAGPGAVLAELLEHNGHQVEVRDGGVAAWEALQHDYFPLVFLDRRMPDLDGLELCRRIRARRHARYTYVILATVVGGKEPYLQGMDAGADDYLTKPLDPDELRARVRVAERVLGLRDELAYYRDLVTICAYCKNIRNELGEWIPVERYVEARTQAALSHGICPCCYHLRVAAELDRLRTRATDS